MVVPSRVVKVAGLPAFRTGPSACSRADAVSLSATRAVMPTITSTMALTKATATILTWVVRSAPIREWVISRSSPGPRRLVAGAGEKVQSFCSYILIHGHLVQKAAGHNIVYRTRGGPKGATIRARRRSSPCMTMAQAYFRRMSCFISRRKQWLATSLPHFLGGKRAFFSCRDLPATKCWPPQTGAARPQAGTGRELAVVKGALADGHVVAGGEDGRLAGLYHGLVLHHGAGRLEVAEVGGNADHDEHHASHQRHGQDLEVGDAVGAEQRVGHGSVPCPVGSINLLTIVPRRCFHRMSLTISSRKHARRFRAAGAAAEAAPRGLRCCPRS